MKPTPNKNPTTLEANGKDLLSEYINSNQKIKDYNCKFTQRKVSPEWRICECRPQSG
jgi:hypothetical protein